MDRFLQFSITVCFLLFTACSSSDNSGNRIDLHESRPLIVNFSMNEINLSAPDTDMIPESYDILVTGSAENSFAAEINTKTSEFDKLDPDIWNVDVIANNAAGTVIHFSFRIRKCIPAAHVSNTIPAVYYTPFLKLMGFGYPTMESVSTAKTTGTIGI